MPGIFNFLLFSGLLVFSLCIPTKDLSSQSEDREFYSDLESSQLLLAAQNSRPSLPSRISPPQSAVHRGDSHGTQASVGRKSSETRVRRAAVELLTEEGSGMLEATTTTMKSPVTATTTTINSPVRATTTTSPITATTTTSPVTTTTTNSPVTATATTTNSPVTATTTKSTVTATTTNSPETATTTTTTKSPVTATTRNSPETATTTTTMSPVTATSTNSPVTATTTTTTKIPITATTTTTTKNPVTATTTNSPVTATTTTTTNSPVTGTTTNSPVTATTTTTINSPVTGTTTNSPVTATTTNSPVTATTTTTTKSPVTATTAMSPVTATTTNSPETATTTTTNSPVTSTTKSPVTATTTNSAVTATTTTTKIPVTLTTTTTRKSPVIAMTTNRPVTVTTTTTTKSPVTPPTTTTTATTTTTTTTAASNRPRFIVAIRVLLLKAFNSAFNNPQSSAYQQQVTSFVSWCTPIYRRRYGSHFIRVLVISMRSSARYRQENTEVEIQVEFDQDAPEAAPSTDDLVQALRLEASTSNPLSVDTNSIQVTRAPRVTANSHFTTNETFVVSLLTVNSTSFRERAALIKRELEPFFQEDYSPDFICLTPKSFSDGRVYPNSIVHLSDLCFTYNATLPSATAIYNTMLRAARSGKLTMDIIFVNGTGISASSSGDISSKISLFTTCSLTLLTVLVTQPW